MSARHRARLLAEEEERKRLAAVKDQRDGIMEDGEEEQEGSSEEEEEEEEEAPRTGFAFLNESDSDESDSDSDSDSDALTSNDMKLAEKSKNLAKAPPCAPSKEEREQRELEFLEGEITRAKEDAQIAKESESGQKSGLFIVKDLRHLNPDNELKRKLGKLGISGHQQQQQEQSAVQQQMARVQQQRRRRGAGGGSSRLAHKSLFCTLNDSEAMPPPPAFASGGARMNLIKSDGFSRFTFEASDTYRAAQRIFEHVNATMDPNEIVAFLNRHPWHVPAYLTMSDVYLQTSQLESAEAMLRTALYILEGWLHPRFPELLEKGQCRIQIDKSAGLPSENSQDPSCGLDQAFLRALFRSMIISRRKSLFQASFSLALALYSFDPTGDPFFVLLVLDDLALWAGEYEFVKSLASSSQVCHHLPGLPFSAALALELMGEESQAATAAQSALVKHPGLFVHLVQELEKHGLDVASDPMLQSALAICKRRALSQDVTTAVERLYTFFAHMGRRLWSSKKAQTGEPVWQWLAFQATRLPPLDQGIIDAADAKDDFNDAAGQGAAQDETGETGHHSANILDYYAKVQLAHFVDDTGAANVVDDVAQAGPGAPGVAATAAEPNVNLDTNLVNLFFQTMMPWAVLPANENEDDTT